MKKNIFAILATTAILATGCVRTVSDTNSFAMSWGKDTMSGRYQRSLDQVYDAAKTVIAKNGVMIQEYIPHDTTNAVRSLEGRVSDRKVWISVEAVDPKTTQVNVEARTSWGLRDLDLVHFLEKEIAIQLAR